MLEKQATTQAPQIERAKTQLGAIAAEGTARTTALEASIAGVAGYFADRAWRPPSIGLPRLRSWQRRQLKVMLAWAARQFDLPDPRWISAVPD